MKISASTWAKVGLVVEFAAFLACIIRFLWLQVWAPVKVALMTTPWPYFEGAVVAMAYVIASFVLFRKGKHGASAILAGAMVLVLLALKLAYA